MGKAVLASQTTSDLFAGNADDLDRMADLRAVSANASTMGVGIGVLRGLPLNTTIFIGFPFLHAAGAQHVFSTKTNGAIQAPRFSYSHSLEESLLETWH